MAQVFISYAREDAAAARRLADELGRRGWDVWWDPELIAGQHFDEVIERELRISGAVVVLWSTHSVESQWVRAEASAAADRNVLVPARLADVELPLRFINLETADLTSWWGEPDHEGLADIVRALVGLVGEPVPPAPVTTPDPPHGSPVTGPTPWVDPAPAADDVTPVVVDPEAAQRRRRLALAGAGLGLAVVVLIALVVLLQPDDDGGITAETLAPGSATTTGTAASSEATDTGETSRPSEGTSAGSDHPASELHEEEEIFRGAVLTSDDGRFRLHVQDDGNVTIYPVGDPGDVRFATMTHDDDALKLRMQDDGNLVVYSRADDAVWASHTDVRGSYVSIDDDGHLRIYGPDGTVVWSTEVVVPAVVGRSERAARGELTEAGLRVAVRHVTDGGAPGSVMASAPGAGTHLYRDAVVTLTVVAVPTTTAPPTTVEASTTTTSRIPRG